LRRKRLVSCSFSSPPFWSFVVLVVIAIIIAKASLRLWGLTLLLANGHPISCDALCSLCFCLRRRVATGALSERCPASPTCQQRERPESAPVPAGTQGDSHGAQRSPIRAVRTALSLCFRALWALEGAARARLLASRPFRVPWVA